MKKHNPANSLFAILPFPEGFEVSWAGPDPFGEGVCFGSEDGLFQFFDERMTPIGPVFSANRSGEAINSVAHVGPWLALSSRQDIAFVGKEKQNGERDRFHTSFGAHHLAITASGCLVATLGRSGLLFATTNVAKGELLLTGVSADEKSYAYRVLALPGTSGRDLIVCAGRSGGISFGEWSLTQAEITMRAISFAGLDVVDVCSIGNRKHPRAIAALCKDGAIVLSEDISGDQNPSLINYASLRGTAYRVVQCRGHLFVLTTSGVFGLWNLADKFVNGTLGRKEEILILAMQLEATDINVVMDRYLMIVMLEGVGRVDISLLQSPEKKPQAKDKNGSFSKDRGELSNPVWKSRGVSQVSKEITLSV